MHLIDLIIVGCWIFKHHRDLLNFNLVPETHCFPQLPMKRRYVLLRDAWSEVENNPEVPKRSQLMLTVIAILHEVSVYDGTTRNNKCTCGPSQNLDSDPIVSDHDHICMPHTTGLLDVNGAPHVQFSDRRSFYRQSTLKHVTF